MNSGVTWERVYDALKRRLLEHRFLPGDRLEPTVLADSVSSSVTPVRETLHILTGERLLETRQNGGFHVPQVDQPGLSDLYAWNADVLTLAIKAWPTTTLVSIQTPLPADPATAIRLCFDRIAQASRNAEHGMAVRQLSDRLNAVRCVEPSVLGLPDAELSQIVAAAMAGDRAGLARRVVVFHRQRVRHAAAIVRALYRRSD